MNVKYIKDLQDLQKELEEFPDHLKYYTKAEILIGSEESIEYIRYLKKIKKSDNPNSKKN